MKKIILSAIAVCAFGFANAQDKGGTGLASGNIVLTGDVNYSSTTFGPKKSSSMTLSPGLGYMMSDNLMLVGQVGIKSGSGSETHGNDAKTSGLELVAGVRYFFTPADKFSLSLGGEFTYGSDKTNEGVNAAGDPVILPSDAKINKMALTVPVGLHYFVSDNFAVNATWGALDYTSSKEDATGAEAENTLGLGLNMSSLSFGLLYKL
jgi:opacity protein-like surface antigen